ncbi:MAG: 2-oxoglutarate dehydrogenase E1 component, partial [Gammaproteobacteria bacterium]|nr:2-oxoglutarate dehydrogenase E1 component [Gammaproteobacteria bacterium]
MAESFVDRMLRSSHLAGTNVAYIEDMYETYLDDPNSVPGEWRDYFNRLPRVEGALEADVPHSTIVQHFERLGRNRLKARPERESTMVLNAHEQKQMRVQDLISAYRHRGHKKAGIDPLGMMERPPTPILDLAYHHLSPADLEEIFHLGSFHFGDGKASLRELVDALEQTYCGSIGFEYMHIIDQSEQLWVQQRLESVRARPQYSMQQKHTILERLTAAEGLEKYLHGRYPGTKRFGLEGAESFIPMLHEMLQRLGSHGVIEAVLGMAHRGRLNVLVNILGKDPWDLFDE